MADEAAMKDFALTVDLSWSSMTSPTRGARPFSLDGEPFAAVQGEWQGEWPGGDWQDMERGQRKAENPVNIRRPDGSTISAQRAVLDLPVEPDSTGERVTLIVMGLTAEDIPAGSVITLFTS